MLNTIITGGEITMASFLICTAVSLALGAGTALLCTLRSRYTPSFALTLAILPAMVQMVIMLVNGNIGAGVAVAGAFGLVRFRSAPGTAREIAMIFLAMSIGLATGMGYVVIAGIFFVIIALFVFILSFTRIGSAAENTRELKITIGENIDYEGLFDDLLLKYTASSTLDRVRTTNMGTLYELTWRVTFPDGRIPKAFLDEIRCRNGNLTVAVGRVAERETL